jgi:hypothetical protein
MKQQRGQFFLSLVTMALMSHAQESVAEDSGTQSLGNKIGIVDTYTITCQAPSTHLDFKLRDTTNQNATSINTLPKPAPQIINAHLSKTIDKKKVVVDALSIIPNEYKELTLKGGNGAYQLTLDTLNTNLQTLAAQNYTVQYRCLNATDSDTTPVAGGLKTGIDSPIKTLKNKAKATLNFSCAKHKTLGNTDKIYIKITNKLVIPANASKNNSAVLSGQIYKDQTAINTTDLVSTDDNFSEKVTLNAKSGNYLAIIGTSATDNTKNNAKTYLFEYHCLDELNTSKPATLLPLENN